MIDLTAAVRRNWAEACGCVRLRRGLIAGFSLLAACNGSTGLPADETDGLRYPIALQADPSGTRVFALGANFDRLYRAGRMRAIDTATDRYVVDADGAPAATEVPSFGGKFAIEPSVEATSAVAYHLMVPARDDDSVVVLDVDKVTPTAMGCEAEPLTGICTGPHRIAAEYGVYPVGDDPVAATTSAAPDGRRRVHVVAANNGQITLLDYDPHEQPIQLRSLDVISSVAGLNSIVVSPLSQRAYVTSTRSSALIVYRVDPGASADRPWLLAQEPSVVLPASGAGDYGRGLALSSDASRLYVAWRSPASLQIVDIVPDATGAPANRIVDSVILGAKPSEVAVAPVGPGGRDWVYVSCYGDDAIWVVDPQLRETVARIPMRLAVTDADGSARIVRGSPFALSAVDVPGQGWRLYAGLFSVPPVSQHEVVVIPIAEGAANRHTADHVVLPGTAKLAGGTP